MDLYETFLDKVGNAEFALNSIGYFVKCAIEVVEISKIEKTKRKEAAIALISRLVEDCLDEKYEEVYESMLQNGIISDMIDTIIFASKGKIEVNKQIKNCCNIL